MDSLGHELLAQRLAQIPAVLAAMLRDVGLSAFVIRIDAPPLTSIFGFEPALNALVFAVMRYQRVDKVNWPGKGRDDLLYGFCPDV